MRASNQLGFKVDIPIEQRGLPHLAVAASRVSAGGRRDARRRQPVHAPNIFTYR